jgi:hypothetical protein
MKKIFSILIVILFSLLCCSPKLNDAKASEIIRESFDLSESDSIEILGISDDSKDVMIVKFKLNDTQLSSKMRKYDKGWQLDEIQNDFGMWVPANNLTQLSDQKDKLRSTMKDMVVITTGLIDYITDHGVAPNQEGIYEENSEVYRNLVPFYLKNMSIKDKWGNNYIVFCGTSCNGNYGISGCVDDDVIVISYGKDGQQDTWQFDKSDPDAGLYLIKEADDYNNDLVLWSGTWLRAPREEN